MLQFYAYCRLQIGRVDVKLCHFFDHVRRYQGWDQVIMRMVAQYGPYLFFILMASLLAGGSYVPFSFSYRVNGVIIAIVSASMTKIVIDPIARSCSRQRPFVSLHLMPLIEKDGTDPSFPSNHAGGAFALAVALSLYFPSLLWLSFFLAMLISFSRLYAGVHYLTDLIAGATIGAVIAILVCILLS